MPDFKATVSQRAAMEERGSAVLVAAGAGSGKTKVLTERLMRYVCDENNPAEIDSFLVITFTKAAAGELRGRISEELAQRLAEDPGNKRLRRQSALLQRAQIGTIHSFCAALLRENCHLVGLSPDFKIADEERSTAMKAAALERVMEQHYEHPEKYPGFIELADTVGAGRDDKRLSKLVLNLHARMQSHARPDVWARKQIESLRAQHDDVSKTEWGKEIMGWADGLAEYWCDALDELMEKIRDPKREREKKVYMETLSNAAEQLRELRRCLNIGWDKARECLPIEFTKVGYIRNNPEPELAERIKARRSACKKDTDKIAKAFNASSAELLSDMAACAPAMEALLELTMELDRLFTADKRKRAFVDYNDLEHLAAQLLTDEEHKPTDFARELSARYTEIMVDEYQDVSRVQDEIFFAMSKAGKNLFMVGDIKQSIYRFRLAEPKIFTGKFDTYKNYQEASEGEARRILLRENFRSRREILNAANSVFSLCMSKPIGEVIYDDNESLICGASYPGTVPKPELIILEAPQKGEDEESPDKTEYEARLAAARIKRLFDEGTTVTDGGVQRPLEYGDIAILMRSANSVGGIYRRVLSEHGIPVNAAQGSEFFATVEVSAVVSLLAIIDNPHQDIPLIAVLRSPCFGFTADELSAIRAKDKSGDFYSALTIAAEEDDKCCAFTSRLSSLRAVAADLTAAELTWQIINELDMLSICSAMDDGAQRRANLLELIELSERFEGTGYRGVHRFVLWLRALAEKGQDISTGAAENSAVQIMTIHKSKGLEFPVVFLCDTARKFNRQDTGETVLIHPELGLGPKFTNIEKRIEYPTLARNAIKRRLEREMLSEEMRLLYVAMTRPKERLIMTALVKNSDKKLEDYSAAVEKHKAIAPETLAQAGSMADWLIYASLADDGENFTRSICYEPEAVTAAEAETENGEADAVAAEELNRRLSFTYAYDEAEALPSKVTATELKGHAEKDEDAENIQPKKPRNLRLPDFARKDRPVTGTEKGIATHLVMQYMDFEKGRSREGIESEIERLRVMRFLSDREAEAVDAKAIEKLFASPIGQRMLSAEEVKREFKFSLLWPAEEIFPGAEGEELLLQGVVDCYILEGEELTVIDYKTDRVRTAAEIAERAELYRGQLEAYSKALERICGRKVRERVLYFLVPGKAVTV